MLLENIDNWLNLIEKDDVAISIVKKIKDNSIPLGDLADVSQGLIPYDKYRGHSEETIKNKIWNADYKKDETYKKELRGKDVSRYFIKWNGKDWISYGEWLAAPRKPEFFKEKRILIREITNPRIFATYTDEEYYNTPSIINCINFKEDIFFILGIVNSKLMSFYHCANSPKSGKGLFPKILVNDVRKLPIKKSDDMMKNKISSLVMGIIKEDILLDEIDKQIDNIVYQIYEINDIEKQYIENWFA